MAFKPTKTARPARSTQADKPVKPRNRGMRSVGNLFGDVLPPNYRQRTAEIAQMQAFFGSLTDDPVYAYVQVLDVDSQQLSLAVPSSGVLNYLRLHTREIHAMLEEQFGRSLVLNMSVQPAGQRQGGAERARLKPAQHCSQDVSSRVERSAQAIEDDALRAAMQRLSRSIRRSD